MSSSTTSRWIPPTASTLAYVRRSRCHIFPGGRRPAASCTSRRNSRSGAPVQPRLAAPAEEHEPVRPPAGGRAPRRYRCRARPHVRTRTCSRRLELAADQDHAGWRSRFTPTATRAARRGARPSADGTRPERTTPPPRKRRRRQWSARARDRARTLSRRGRRLLGCDILVRLVEQGGLATRTPTPTPLSRCGMPPFGREKEL
jgi:hypothetical protein